MAIEPQLGTLDDFDHFVAVAERLGLKIASYFAVSAHPDHPWVSEHADNISGIALMAVSNMPRIHQSSIRIFIRSASSASQKVLNEESTPTSVLLRIGQGVKIFHVETFMQSRSLSGNGR